VQVDDICLTLGTVGVKMLNLLLDVPADVVSLLLLMQSSSPRGFILILSKRASEQLQASKRASKHLQASKRVSKHRQVERNIAEAKQAESS